MRRVSVQAEFLLEPLPVFRFCLQQLDNRGIDMNAPSACQGLRRAEHFSSAPSNPTVRRSLALDRPRRTDRTSAESKRASRHGRRWTSAPSAAEVRRSSSCAARPTSPGRIVGCFADTHLYPTKQPCIFSPPLGCTPVDLSASASTASARQFAWRPCGTWDKADGPLPQ
jgi:hypothetical protein